MLQMKSFMIFSNVYKVVREPRRNNNVGLRRMRNRVVAERESSEDEPQEQPVEQEQPDEEEDKGPKVERFVGKAANLSKKKLKKLQDKEDRAKYREVLFTNYAYNFNSLLVYGTTKERNFRKRR